MPRSRIPSPARSQGVVLTPRRDKLRSRTRFFCSPAQCNVPVRLSYLVSESYKLSPNRLSILNDESDIEMVPGLRFSSLQSPNRLSILNDESDIEMVPGLRFSSLQSPNRLSILNDDSDIELVPGLRFSSLQSPNRLSILNDDSDIELVPGRESIWKKLGDYEYRDVMDALGRKDMAEIKNLSNEFDVEVLSEEKNNYTLDLPESSDGIPQQNFAQIQNRDSQSNKHKSHVHRDKYFPASLLNTSINETMNKTNETTISEVKVQVRSLFGNRPGTKRKNMFADFILSDSEEDIPDIQPKVFGFQKNVNKKRREYKQAFRLSPTSSIDLELDDWKLLHENSEQNSTEENGEKNESNEQNNTKENSEQNISVIEIVSDIEDQNESREAQDESDQIDLEQEQNETEEQNEDEKIEDQDKNISVIEIVSDIEDQNESRKAQDESDQIDLEQEQNETEGQNEDGKIEDQDQNISVIEIVSDIEDQNESRKAQDESDQIDLEQEQNETEGQNEDEKIEDQDQNISVIEIVSDIEDQNESREAQDESDQIDLEQEQNETEEQNEDEKIEDQDEENEDQIMEYDQDMENEEEEEEDDEEQDTENDQQESNESEVEINVDDSEQVDHDGPIEEENYNEDGEVSGNKNDESPNITHDTNEKHKNIQKVTSPEAILHYKTNQIDSFIAEGRNSSVQKTKSIMKTLNIRPSLAPETESTGFSDGTRNSSSDNSGWDSHRKTRKTLRQTFGKDFTPRKSLRALVMEKSAKLHTNFVVKEADLAENGAINKISQANSTELPHFDSYEDPEPVHVDETVISTMQESNHEEHDMLKRTRQMTLEMYYKLQKIKRDNMERRRRIEEQVRNSPKTTTQTYNPFLVPTKPVRRVKPAESKPRTKETRPGLVSIDNKLPAEIIEDMKNKPPKRFKPRNASWVTKRLYKFLETKLEPKYGYKARVRAEKLVKTIYNFTKDVKKHHVAPLQMVDALKFEMARLNIVTTHFDFYEFFQNYMPREIRIKVNPDVVNNIPKQGVFADIIT